MLFFSKSQIFIAINKSRKKTNHSDKLQEKKSSVIMKSYRIKQMFITYIYLNRSREGCSKF